jgi:hypothetical protein
MPYLGKAILDVLDAWDPNDRVSHPRCGPTYARFGPTAAAA